MNDKRPTERAVKVSKRGRKVYKVYPNGELWTSGDKSLPGGFMCGHVMNPENIEEAIDNHEEEMACLLAGLGL